MAFPQTTVLDDFNRADGTLGNNWSAGVLLSQTACTVSSNKVRGATAARSSWWMVGGVLGPDCEVYITLPDIANAGQLRLFARLHNMGEQGVRGYLIQADTVAGAGNDTVGIYRIDSNARTLLGLAFTQELAAGDKIGFELNASVLTAYYKSVSGAWTNLGTRTDDRYKEAGRIGVGLVEASSTVFSGDDFGGGTIAGNSLPIVNLVPEATLSGF